MSVRLRLTLLQTLLLGLVLTAFALIVYAAIAAQETSQLNYDLRLQAEDMQERALNVRLIATQHAGTTLHVNRSAVRGDDLSAAIAERLDGSAYSAQVVQRSGRVIGWSSDLDEPIPVSEPLWDQVEATSQLSATVTVDDQELRVYGTLLNAGLFREPLMLLVATSLEPLQATLAAWRLTLAMIVLGTTALSAAIAWFMATRALQPVDRMARAARAIGQETDFTRRIPEPPQADELGRLARTFNEMLEQLAGAYTTQRRFLADASHELRTPLTVVSTNVAALLRGVEKDPVEREETLRAISRETDRMSRLVADLLALARADAGQELVRRRVAFDTVVLDVYQQQQSMAGGVTLTLGDWEQAEVEGDPDRLKQVVLNLVDNALRHTPPGGTVTLSLHRVGAEIILRVQDTGMGIAPEHLGRIFERFYRADQPRARHAGGTGLGLAIAREVANAHGGRIEVESTVGAGSTFSFILPLASPVPRPTAARGAATVQPRPQTSA